MKTVALISGGKDSILAILLALRYGHQPVVLANITPAPLDGATEGTDVHEIDSYMFQTVGHETVDSIAACLELPLRRAAVCGGQSKNQTLMYSEQPPEDDEVEDLCRLLRAVKEEFPMVEGVTTGAILSNYQRHRVEIVCRRLGLVSLSYLWQRQPFEVLDMASVLHVEALLVKTASIGLDPRKLLGRTLEEVRPVLLHMEDLYRSHMAGEGGEYETIVMNCPLYKSSYLRVVKKDVVMVDDNEYSPSGHCILTVERVEKDSQQKAQDAEVLKLLVNPEALPFPSDRMAGLPDLSSSFDFSPCPAKSYQEAEGDVSLGLLSQRFTLPPPTGSSGTFTEQATSLLNSIYLWAQGAQVECVLLSVRLSQSAMEVPFNTLYEKLTPSVMPPCRSLVIGGGGASLVVDVLHAPARQNAGPVLHNQSLSCWAAGMVGPYAQARQAYTPGEAAAFHTVCGAVLGLVPTTGCLASPADLPAAWRSHPDLLASSALAQAVAETVYGCANLRAYLSFFNKPASFITHATVHVTASAVAELSPYLSSLWELCLGAPWDGVTYRHIITVDRLQGGASVSILANVMELEAVSGDE